MPAQFSLVCALSMNLSTRTVVPALLLCGALAGCRTDPSVALLEAELRWMEDQIYALENQYQIKCQELESCRLAQQATASAPSPAEPAAEREPSSRRPREDDTDLRPLQAPQVEGVPDLRSSGDADPPSLLEPPSPAGGSVRPSSFHMLADTNVTHILLNRQLTGGYDRDGIPGDDGVMVVIEPRNASGQFVPLPGEAMIELRDPEQLTPDKQLIARWKLTPRQSDAKMRKSLLGRGVHLELAWPSKPPPAGEYEIDVTYSAAGQKLTASREVRIDPPRDPSLRWTPVSDATVENQPLDPSVGVTIDEVPDESVLALPPPVGYPERTGPLPQNNSIDPNRNWSPGR